ncbi:MAG TPA: DUF1338 domain-containing protein [Bacteroidales bacterium]|nr:DUF1338 domain-containing protein [Bacteroidales bacterium]
MTKEQIFATLWEQYTQQNPAVQRVYDLFTAAGEEVVNDHIAFRTYDDPRINIEVLSQPFLKAGYVEKGQYHFEEKKLFARHFEHITDPKAPRVFISELLTAHFSPFLQETVKACVDAIPQDVLASPTLVFEGLVWGTPSFEVYETLRNESEYAAWLYANGFRANHFTVSVNYLKELNSLEKVNQFLKDNGFRMNDAGGEIKGTPSELLEQSSIKSEMIQLAFSEGIREIPGCYYEFARRYPDADGTLYSGFIAKSADKIFESTNFYQK